MKDADRKHIFHHGNYTILLMFDWLVCDRTATDDAKG